MRSIAAFAHLMRDTLTYQAASTERDAYGDVTYGTPRKYRARIVGKQKLIRGFNGQEIVSAQTVYLGAALRAQPDDRVILSTAITGSTEDTAISPPILGAARYPDQQGQHHSVLYLG